MKQSFLYALWGALFILCAGLGFVPSPGSALRILMTLLSVAFFIPGVLLLKQARRSGDSTAAIVVRNLSMASLVLSALLSAVVLHEKLTKNMMVGIAVAVGGLILLSM